MPDDSIVREILEQILDALHKIQWRFAPIKSSTDFTESPQGMEKLDSICMLLVAIGESCKKVDRLTDNKLFALSQPFLIGISRH